MDTQQKIIPTENNRKMAIIVQEPEYVHRDNTIRYLVGIILDLQEQIKQLKQPHRKNCNCNTVTPKAKTAKAGQ